VKSSQYTLVNIRSYTNLAATIANISGILNFSMLLFNVINYFYSKAVFLNKLVGNSIFYTNLSKDGYAQIQLNTSTVPFNVNSTNANLKKRAIVGNEKVSVMDSELNLKKGEDNNSNIMNLHKESNNLRPIDPKLINHENLNILAETKKNMKSVQFTLMRYKYDNSLQYLTFMAFCSCCHLCCREYAKQTKIRDFSVYHYAKYLDYFNFVEKLIEMEIVKKLLFKKEEIEIIQILKRLILVKNDDIIDCLKSGNYFANSLKGVKKKSSFDNYEEKLKQYLTKINSKEDSTNMESNMILNLESIIANKDKY
jgi:hypothetical protein